MITLTETLTDITVTLQLIEAGPDYCVVIYGGECPHIGAVAMGQPRPSLQDSTQTSASVSVLTVMGHKEDLLAHSIALRLASRLNAVVCVTCGIHIDDAHPDQIKVIQKLVNKLIEKLIAI
ncbi:hypothetical protein F9817_09570 [Vibrio sp. CAIM 722]|uniref:Prenylated flavin chaperone LpdD-like domain-containing protein n=1 Tax=Vibrio eleionomae TaxID=2653505 RepID=A0A7X4LKE0_9VIBR|nr:hypothetical protein [Vibrio eleionomae]MZI93446.1 hypothetical protein [Vibrio eleionomae]